jgi:hypothetical protein
VASSLAFRPSSRNSKLLRWLATWRVQQRWWPQRRLIKWEQCLWTVTRLASATVRRNGISRSQMLAWWRAFGAERSGAEAVSGLVPAVILEPPMAATPKMVSSCVKAHALSNAYDGGIQMIDSIRMHQHATNAKKDGRSGCMARSRGGLTTKIHALVDASRLRTRHENAWMVRAPAHCVT